MNITDKEAKALAAWAESNTTAWGRKFDDALAVAQRIANALKVKKKAPPPKRGQPPKATWR